VLECHSTGSLFGYHPSTTYGLPPQSTITGLLNHTLQISLQPQLTQKFFVFTRRFLVTVFNTVIITVSLNYTLPDFMPKQKQKLTAGNQPARSHLALGPAGTHGHIFVQCQDLCFFFLSLIILIDKGGAGLFICIYIGWCSLTTPYST
jgi:hypothetical protein